MDGNLLEEALGYIFLHYDLARFVERAKKEASSVVHRLVLPVDVGKLKHHSETLGALVVNQLESATKIFQLVCFTALDTLELFPSLKSPSQLCLVLKLHNIPLKNRLSICEAVLIRSFPTTTVQLEGKVYSKSPTVLYTQSAHYQCPSSSCPGSEPYRYIRLHCPGASEADTIRGRFECDYCGQDLQEDVQRRVLSDRCQIQLISSDISASGRNGHLSSAAELHRAITVVLRDELVNAVTLGQTCQVVGQLLFEPEDSQSPRAHLVCTIEANNVVPVNCLPNLVLCPVVNDKISKLKQACAYSPWAFPATVAYSFAGRICPPGVFHRLKLSLLLSLVSILDTSQASLAAEEMEEEEVSVINTRKHGLHVLSISSDDLLQSRLMSYASEFSPVCLRHNQATSELFGTVGKQPASGCSLLSAGSLFLSSRGVCLLGNLSRYKKDTQARLQHVLEEDCAVFSIPDRDEQKTGSRGAQKQQIQLPLQCSTWAYADGNGHRSRRSPAAAATLSGKAYFDYVGVNKALVDRFDLVVSTQCGSVAAEDLSDAKLCNMLLEACCSPSVQLDHSDCLLEDDDIKQLLHLAAAKKPSFAKGSQDLIRSFYMASRQMRSSGAFGTDISATAIHSMTCVAAAHAALCLRSEVTEDDATAAILLFEEAVVACYGTSVLNVSCQPHFRDDDLDAYLGEQHCSRMKQFQSQLHHFCSVHGNLASGEWEE